MRRKRNRASNVSLPVVVEHLVLVVAVKVGWV